jgi:hypothetical protein
MTVEARYNLQHGVNENYGRAATTYSPTNELDYYILARVKLNRLIIDKSNYSNVVKCAATDIAESVRQELKDLVI